MDGGFKRNRIVSLRGLRPHIGVQHATPRTASVLLHFTWLVV